MKNWKTNMGGAISVTGTTLIGVGVLGNMTDNNPHSKFLWWMAATGFIMSAIGKGLTALFAADASTVVDNTKEIEQIKNQINQP